MRLPRAALPLLLALWAALCAREAAAWQAHSLVKPLPAIRPASKRIAQRSGELSLGAARKQLDVPASFSLDKSVFPRRPYLLEGVLAAALAPAVLTAADAAFSKMLVVTVPALRAVAALLGFLLEQASKIAEKQTARADLFTDAAQQTGSSITGFGEQVIQSAKSLFSFAERGESLDLEQWQPCKLVSKEKLSSDYAIYRFELANSRAVLPLNPGEELSLCARDSRDELVKEAFFPISPRNAKGYFEVLVKKTAGTTDAAVLAAAAVGDELAVKAGRDHLSSKAPEERIESMQIVASAEGIAPAIQTLQAVLQPKDSTVKSVDLIWVNEHQHEFMLAKQVEALARRYSKKLRVTAITDSDLYGHDITNHPTMKQTLKRFEPSTMALVCGPDYVVDRVQRYLANTQDYPHDHIAAVKF